jgi:GntR family transcriptional regulator
MTGPGVVPSVPSVPLQRIAADSYGQVKARLRELIDRLGAEGTLRLPSEERLATALGVSRATVRSALHSLQKEGRIRRLHGAGTFINRHVLGVTANLAEAGAFVDLLADCGFEVGLRTSQRETALADDVTTALEIPAGESGWVVERVFTAGGRPAVFSVDYVPTRLLRAPSRTPEPEDSTFAFVSAHVGRAVCYSVAEVRPLLPPPHVRTALEIEPDHPLLFLRHVHVHADESPLAVTKAYVNDDYLRFSVIRGYLDQ